MTVIKDIPILIAKSMEEIEAIQEPYAYIIGKDGFYIKKTNKFFKSLAKIESIPNMLEVKEYCILNEIDRLPYEIVQKTIVFFKRIFAKYKSEAVVLLLHDASGWDLYVPTQSVGAASLSYTVNAEDFKGKTLAGSIHSHADFGAFHSGGDSDDEMNFDGIHITIGNVNSSLSFSCSIVVNGFRQMVDINDVIKDIPEVKIDDAWISRVNEFKETIPKEALPLLSPLQPEYGYGNYNKSWYDEDYEVGPNGNVESKKKKKKKKKGPSAWEGR